MDRENVTDELIDRYLEFLYERSTLMMNDMRSHWPGQPEWEIRRAIDANNAYLRTAVQYNRDAPTIRAGLERFRRERDAARQAVARQLGIGETGGGA